MAHQGRRAVVAVVLLGLAGCGGGDPGIQTAQRAVDALQAAVDLLRPIVDASSAQAAIPQMQPVFGDLAVALDAMISYTQEHGLIEGRAKEVRTLQASLQRLEQELQQQEHRLRELPGLPADFWNAFRVEAYRLARTAVRMQAASMGGDPALAAAVEEVGAMFDRYGPEQVIEIKLTQIYSGDKDSAIEKIRASLPEAQVVDFAKPQEYDVWLVTVAPVADFARFASGISFGNVVRSEEASREITVELTSADAALATSASTAYDAVPDGQQYSSEESGYEGRGGPPPVEMALPEIDLVGSAQQWFAGWVDRVADGAARVATMEGGMSFGPAAAHAQLAEQLFDPESPQHEMAIRALLGVKPQDVADRAVRQRIAQGFRQVAFESQQFAPEGVQGLVLWGGKFSVPLLAQLLERGDYGSEAAIYEALASIKTPEAAAAVVARLEGSYQSEAALECLRQMGEAAEDALLSVLPMESAEANLGEVGGKKSVALLRRATSSENDAIVEAALEAIRQIQQRERDARNTQR
ncbi:MAG TPA: hypothetical protein PJ982_02025 [Lacipirellulaceae bacterium]|nr:hypothetical protein [Lacipirellulaceae bacterium]